jgi:hypothetical protein
MIHGLKLTFSGAEIRELLEARIDDHKRCAEGLEHERTRTSEDETADAPLLPDHICANEAERHAWRADVLRFIRDHLDPAETYRLCAADLEMAELLPSKPGWLKQAEYEERSRVEFMLERMTKAVQELVVTTQGHLWRRNTSHEPADASTADVVEETEEFRAIRPDLGDGPEVIVIQRK